MKTPQQAALDIMEALEYKRDYSNFNSQGSFKGEFAQDWLFGLAPTKFVQKMMFKGINDMLKKKKAQ